MLEDLLHSRIHSVNTMALDNLHAKIKKQRLVFSRLAMALFGGAALIAPMLIMTLHQSKLTSLLTTSVFVVGVAVALAWRLEDAKNQDIVAATAAYAAVLVCVCRYWDEYDRVKGYWDEHGRMEINFGDGIVQVVIGKVIFSI